MNKAKVDILDIIFQYKNKMYGAYKLRKEYPMYVSKAMGITMLILLLVFGGAYASIYLRDAWKSKPKLKLTDFEMQAPPPMNENDPPPPPPPLPPQVEIARFTPPVIVEDNEVEQKDDVKPVEEVRNVGVIDQEGDTNLITFDEGAGVEREDTTILDQASVSEWASFKDMEQYLADNTQYPEFEKEAGTEGTVKISFVVEKDGTLSSIKVSKGVSHGLDQEALRVVKSMKNHWTPGYQNRRPVRMSFSLPFVFKLE
ncbi:MAG: energy transducer TonB [Flavobacteriaceae bacterium]|nr:energy transducer TonB [Flavobacteriaceae bacterium]